MRREFWEMLVDVMCSVNALKEADNGLTVTSVVLNLPVEVTAENSEKGFQLLVDLPQWRWNSGFEIPPARLNIVLEKHVYEDL